PSGPIPRVRRTGLRCTGRGECRCGPGCRPLPPARDPFRRKRKRRRRRDRHREATVRENLRGLVARLGGLLTVCLLTAFLLFAVFGQLRFADGKTYYAEFTNVSNLREGKLVRIAGVEVGKVKSISINSDATVRVEFSADDSVSLTEGTR